MPLARATASFPGAVEDAEAIWYDTATWPRWVVGLAEVESVRGGWPEPGGEVRWRSGPAGRGKVSERVINYERSGGQTVAVQDDSIRGTQAVSFESDGEDVSITLSLAYELKRRSPLLRLVDFLFIRRAMTRSLEETLSRFGFELEAALRPDVG